MTFRDWCYNKDIDPEKYVCLCISTDGFNLDSSNIFAVSYACPKKTKDYYIAGANAEKVYPYTGVPLDYYKGNAVGMPFVEEAVLPLVHSADIVITHTANKYTVPWLETYSDRLGLAVKHKALDIVNIVKLLESRSSLPTDVNTISELQDRLSSAMQYMSGGYAMKSIIGRYLPNPVRKERSYEATVQNLKALYKTVLNLEI